MKKTSNCSWPKAAKEQKERMKIKDRTSREFSLHVSLP